MVAVDAVTDKFCDVLEVTVATEVTVEPVNCN
jgi:hypothetical protein